MYRSEVEEWLYSIGLPELYSSFVEDGFTTLDSIKRMRQSDIDAIVDRNGYMVVLNEEIDRLNYSGDNNFSSSTGDYRTGGNNDYLDRSSRASTYFEGQANDSYPSREALIYRYEIGGVPAVGFASRHLARRAKSKTRKTRGPSLSRVSVERYVPNSGSEEYEAMFANKRAASVAASIREMEIKKANEKIAEFQRKREEDRQRRARTEMHYMPRGGDDPITESLDRRNLREHYGNEYVWVEKNHITDVGVKYDGITRKVEHKPSTWRCEDEVERGKEYKRMNDECADKIADNRYSIDNSRDWLVDDGGVSDRVYRMSAKAAKTRYDLDSIKRNMDNIKSLRNRLFKY